MGGAKNCPETPRQKMIGMMYLVLTAMLALNVSADILNGFTKLRHSMESSMFSTKERADDALGTFRAANVEKKNAYKEWLDIAEAVNISSNEFYNYIDSFKLDIINMIDGKEFKSIAEMEGFDENGNKVREPHEIENNGETNKPHEYALNPVFGGDSCRASQFKAKMDAYRIYLTVVDSECLLHKIGTDAKFAHDWELKRNMMESLFSTESVVNEEGESISWQRSTFDEMPAGAVLALLTKYQNDIRVAQNDLINFMFSAATGSATIGVSVIQPIVMAQHGEYLLEGQTYSAEIMPMIAALEDSTQKPLVYIDGMDEPLEDGIYTVQASGVGEKTYTGYMVLPDDPEKKFTFTGRYTVGKPSATISNTDLTVIYKGIDNHFSVSANGVTGDKLSVTCTNATVAKSGNGYIIKPTGKEGDIARVTATADLDGRKVVVGTMDYRIKNLPKPDAFLAAGGTYYAGDKPVTRKDVTGGSAKIVADYPADALVKASFKVTQFDVRFPNSSSKTCKGDTFDAATLKTIKQLEKGSTILIRNIKAVGPDGATVELRVIPVELK